jgi:hypothetical protein
VAEITLVRRLPARTKPQKPHFRTILLCNERGETDVELQFSHFAGSDNIEKAVCQVFEDAENVLGRAIIERFSSLLACSEFGLTEMELLELMLPASHANGTPALMQEGHCNFSGLCALRSTLGKSLLAMMRHLSFLSARHSIFHSRSHRGAQHFASFLWCA